MRLSRERIINLQALLREHCDLDYSEEQAQEAGAAIMRFVVAKSQRQTAASSIKENGNEQTGQSKQTTA